MLDLIVSEFEVTFERGNAEKERRERKNI